MIYLILAPITLILYFVSLKLRKAFIHSTKNMTQEDLRDDAIGAFHLFSKRVSQPFKHRVVRQEGAVEVIWTGEKNPYLNTATRMSRATTLAELEDSLQYTQSTFSSLDKDGIPGLVILEASSLFENGVSQDAIRELCLKYNVQAEFDASMALEGGSFDKIDFRGLEIKKVETVEELLDVCNFFFPDNPTDWSILLDFWRSLYSFVGYVDGKMVTTATTHIYNGKAYLSTVGTHEDYRNHGYATAVSEYALQTAIRASGCKISLLHASAMGKPVYEKMGFKTIGTVVFGAYKPTLDA
jgi:ribosomal protein S18 acetylase RimI-like enzyme